MYKVLRADTAALGFCASGVRQYFAAHGINYREFIQDGLPAAAFDRVRSDPMIRRLLEQAARRSGQA